MNTLFFVSILIVMGFVSADIAKKNGEFAMDGILKQVIEQLREMINHGIADFGVPVLDPFQFKLKQFKFSEDYFIIQSNMTDGTLTGLSDFQILQFELSTDDVMLDLEIYMPSLNLSAEYYEMNGNIADAIPLAGKGVFHVEVYGLNLKSKVLFKQSDNGKSALIDRFEKPQFSISHIVSKTAIDDNIDDIANEMIEDLLADYLNRFNKFLAATFSGPVIRALNKVLCKFELW